MEDLVPGGEEGGHFPESENVQGQGEPSFVDAMEMRDGEFWCWSGGLPPGCLRLSLSSRVWLFRGFYVCLGGGPVIIE
jgi:hypothetical protein